MNCSEILGKLIKERRIEYGYSIRKLSDAVGISGTELTRIESGERVTPNLLTLIYICKVLRLDMNNLLTVSGFNSDGKNKLYKMKVTKSTEKIYNISASNDDEAFDNMAKYLEDKGVFDFSEKCELLSTIDKYGITCNFEYLKPIQIQNRLKAIINAYKVNIEMSTLSYLIECCGTDMQELINETRKLIEYAGEGNTIKKEDIDKLSIKKMESIIFDLTDSLGKKNTKQAIEVLRNLVLSKEPLQKILITLYNHFKKLYLTKLAISQNRDVTTSLDLKPNQTFLANKYKAQASYFKQNELRKILQELCDLDYKYKIGLIDLNVGLESILCAYC